MRRWRLICLLGLLSSLTACAANVEIRNAPLLAAEKNQSVKPFNWRPDRPFIILSFSGGGTRAAAMAYDTLQALDKVPDGTGKGTLLDDVGVISSVSGGSVTAAYFGLYGRQGLQDFYTKFLKQDNMRRLESQLFNPWIDAKLLFGAMGRIDAEQALFNDELFHGATYAALENSDGPKVILNATDMASGDVFAFGPSRFNDLCSNLSQLPVSVAVSASAAFPILLSPVTLQDFSYPHCLADPGQYAGPTPDELNKKPGLYTPDEARDALYSNDLRHGALARTDIRYVHLLDGGLADNLGVTTLFGAITQVNAEVPFWFMMSGDGAPKTFVVINVRARSFAESPLYQQAATPGEIAMINAATSIPLDANTDALDEKYATGFQDFTDGISAAEKQLGRNSFQLYRIDIDPAQLQGDQAPLGQAVEAIPTNWTLSDCSIKNMSLAVNDLFNASQSFMSLSSSLNNPPGQIGPTGTSVCNK